jgi:hypothetical protein
MLVSSRVIWSSKGVLGERDFAWIEWEKGDVRFEVTHPRCRVAVRKTEQGHWMVYTTTPRDRANPVTWDIRPFLCESCAKAFSLCIIFGDDFASCTTHSRNCFHYGDLFNGRLAFLCCLVGLSRPAFNSLQRSLINQVIWLVRLISSGQFTWEKVIRAWEFAEQFAKQRNISLDGALSVFCAEAMKIGR